MTHEASYEGSVRADRVSVDPTVPMPAPLPDVPTSGLVVVEVASGEAEVSAMHLLDFCHRWAAEDERHVFLCDACFEAPVLHGVAGFRNGEGLSDAILFGTTLGRIAVSIAHGIRFASAGTAVADADAVRDHARWKTIVEGFEEAGVLLVVALPEGAPEGRLHAAARAVVAFVPETEGETPGDAASEDAANEPDTSADDALTEDWGDIDVVAPTDAETEPRDRDRAEDLVVPIDGAFAAADMGAGVDSGGPGSGSAREPDSDPGSVDGSARPPRSVPPRPSSETRRSSPFTLVLLVVLLGLVVLGYLGVIEIPYITPTDLDITG